MSGPSVRGRTALRSSTAERSSCCLACALAQKLVVGPRLRHQVERQLSGLPKPHLTKALQDDPGYLPAEDSLEDEETNLPDESMLMEVADAWSVDPTLLDAREDLEGLGLISI